MLLFFFLFFSFLFFPLSTGDYILYLPPFVLVLSIASTSTKQLLRIITSTYIMPTAQPDAPFSIHPSAYLASFSSSLLLHSRLEPPVVEYMNE